jgi:hypothetical protein
LLFDASKTTQQVKTCRVADFFRSPLMEVDHFSVGFAPHSPTHFITR